MTTHLRQWRGKRAAKREVRAAKLDAQSDIRTGAGCLGDGCLLAGCVSDVLIFVVVAGLIAIAMRARE